MRIVPGVHPGEPGPLLERHRVGSLEHHPVDRARPAEDLSPSVVDATPVHERLRLGPITPVVEPVTDREAVRRRHVHVRVECVVGTPRLQHQHAARRILTQTSAEHGSRRTAADDDEVIRLIFHCPLRGHDVSPV